MAYREKDTKKWTAQWFETNVMGEKKKRRKRGFETKREALEFERSKKLSSERSMDMKLSDFIEIYFSDKQNDLKDRTIKNKRYMMQQHIVPYFGNQMMSEIKASQIIQWQNEIQKKGYSDSYLRMIQNQLTSLFTHVRLEEAIVQTKAKMVVLDPIQGFLGADVDMHRANEIRPLMKRVAVLAEKYHCAVILIGHMNKNSNGKSSYRGLGSIDFQAAARSVLIVGRVKDEPEVRVVCHTKSSLAPEGTSIAFRLDKNNGFEWIGEYDISADELLNGDGRGQKSRKAKEFLLGMIATAIGNIILVRTISKSMRYSIGNEVMLATGADEQTSEYIVTSGFSLPDVLFCKLEKTIETLRINKREYYGAAEPPVRCGESHLSGLTEPPHFVY